MTNLRVSKNNALCFILDEAYFVLMLPLTKGVVTTLLLFSGELRTESGTVIRVGSFPCNYRSQACLRIWSGKENTSQKRCGMHFFSRKKQVKKKKKIFMYQ